MSLDLMKIDIFKLCNKFPPSLRLKALTKALNIAVPFNFGLGMQIMKLSPKEAILISPEKRKRKNHVGSAHACFLALLSEYPAGLVVAQNYAFGKHRIIISELKIKYFKQGRGTLTSIAKSPSAWPELVDGETFINMQTEITNDKGERVSLCHTRWQVKEWTKVRKKRETK
jgi:acyl-coenzyme A thioesterase PaaI-like protein